MVNRFSFFSLASLRGQLLLLVLGVGILTIMLTTTAIVREQQAKELQHTEREVRTIATLIQGSVNRALRYEIDEAIEEILSELAAHRRISAVLVKSNQGDMIWSHSLGYRHEHIQALRSSIEHEYAINAAASGLIQYSYSPLSRSYQVFVPVVSGSDLLGEATSNVLVFSYGHDFTWLDAFAARLPNIALAALFLVSLIIAVFFYLQRRIARPAEDLVDAVKKRYREDDFPIPSFHPNNEFVILAQAIRSMIGQKEEDETRLKKLSAAVEQSNEGIIITNTDAVIEYVNQALIQNTGYSREELIGSNPRMLASGNTPDSTFKIMWGRLNKGEAWTGELYNRRKDGSEYIELQTITPLRNDTGTVTHFLGVKQDITEQKSVQERLHFLAYFDILTHLPNRVSVLDMLNAELEAGARTGHRGALLLLNIDRMKNINDARGYEYGNQVLLALASRLMDQPPGQGTIGHLGADSFCLIIPARYRDNMQARQVAEEAAARLMHLCAEPFDIEGEKITLTVSVGITLIGNAFHAPEMILRSAETALHNAKDKGGNQCLVYRETDGAEAERIFRLESELRVALEQEQLRLFLQAQINTEGNLAGAEALVRWQHPEHGMVSPGDFIPIAERSDLIVAIDLWVLRHSLTLLREWQDQGHTLSMSVNISPRHIRRAEFVNDVKRLLAETGAAPERLVLEVTEGLLVDDVKGSIEKMKTLSKSGIQFAIDDFGTGYSSLSYIRQLPVHELKIDQSFIRGIPNAKGDVAMVNTIISVAQNLDLKVVAEGIETRAQADFCIANGIWGQGYFYDRPLDVSSWRHKWL